MTTDRTHLSPVIPISLRRWIIGKDIIAYTFVNRACGFQPRRATEIRETGEATIDERRALRDFFNLPDGLLTEALLASKRHYSELALLS